MTMRNSDISVRDAKALLSVRDDSIFTQEGINRRRFLQMVGLGLGGGALLGNIMPGLLPGDWREEAFAAGPLGANQGVLVIVGLYGGKTDSTRSSRTRTASTTTIAPTSRCPPTSCTSSTTTTACIPTSTT